LRKETLLSETNRILLKEKFDLGILHRWFDEVLFIDLKARRLNICF
jgi:hypothetical protein